MQLNKIQFRIVGCSSQENEYPYIELLQQSSHSKGWQSAKFCEYPQTMLLQLAKRTKINQIQFLSHQSKISERMLIYIDDGQNGYKKLGHVKFGDNSQSNYQLREMKSINIDVECEYIKLELYECHVNKFNLFNQIGLIAITLFGNTHVQEQDQLQQNYKYQQLQYQLQFDKNTIKKLTELQNLLDYLVEVENYQNARVIKQTIDRVKQVGAQLRFLEERKTNAVNHQDFDSAVVIKQEIDKLKQAIIPNKVNQLLQQFQNKLQQNNDRKNNSHTDIHNNRQEQKTRSRQEQRQQKEQKQSDEQTYQEDESQMREEDKQVHNLQVEPNKMVDHDELVIPAQGKKKSQKQLEREFEQKQQQLLENKKNPNKQTKKKETRKEPEIEVKYKKEKEVQKPMDVVDMNVSHDEPKLTAEQQSKASEFIDILGDKICIRLFEKDWQVRDEQIKELQQECLKPRRTKNKMIKDVQLGSLGAVVMLINDKVVQVQISSLELLHSILQNNKLVKGSNVLTDYLIQLNEKLLHMIGDSNNRVKEVAQLCYLQLYKTGLMKQQDMLKDLVKEHSDKTLKGFKHISGRLEVLEQLVTAYKMNDSQLQQIVNTCVQYLDHSNGEVRNRAMSILQILCRKYQYQVIKKMMGSIRQAQLDILEAEFDDQQQSQSQQKETKKTQQPQKVKKEQVANQSQNSQMTDVNKVCEFCKTKNPNFTDEQKYDMHLWKECVMLVNCEQCDQIVEIEQYTSHLLDECKYANKYRECGDCKLAVLKADYADHLEDNLNMDHNSRFRKCQLCHKDIKKDFQTHLQHEKCANNPRVG